MSINQKSGRQTFRRRFVSGSLFVSPCPPECYLQSETKIEPDLRLSCKGPIFDFVCNFVTAVLHTETINSLKHFSAFLLNCKICHASTTWKELIRKSTCLPIFRNITEIVKKIKSLYGFEGRCHKITDVCMDLRPCFKSHNLIPVQL